MKRSSVTYRRATVLGTVAALVGLALTGAPVNAAVKPRVSELQRTAQAVVDAGPVGYLARVDNGPTVRTAAAGLADRATKRRLSSRDQYEAGSQTKTFVAVLTLQLAAERKVRLDAPIERYLPGVVPNGENITVRMLLQHTSGLFDYAGDGPLFEQILTNPYTPIPAESLLKIAFSHAPYFAPGTDWAYSNTGYVILGEMLEKLTGQSVAMLLEKRIARPLRLDDTYLADPFPLTTGRGYAHAYIATLSTEATQYTDTAGWALSWASTAGAVVSTARDLSTFYSALLSGRLLPKAQLKQMRTTVDVSEHFGSPSGYGLGVFWLQTPCGTIWGHDGATLGSISTTFASADGKRSFATETTTRLFAADQNDPRLQRFATAHAEAQITAICQMFGKKVPATGSSRAASAWPKIGVAREGKLGVW